MRLRVFLVIALVVFMALAGCSASEKESGLSAGEAQALIDGSWEWIRSDFALNDQTRSISAEETGYREELVFEGVLATSFRDGEQIAQTAWRIVENEAAGEGLRLELDRRLASFSVSADTLVVDFTELGGPASYYRRMKQGE